MTKFSVSRTVPYTARQIYDIVAGVERYREFVPLVGGSSISNLSVRPDGCREFDSELHMAYKKLGISEVLKSHVIADPAAMTVSGTSSEGPVKALDSVWRLVDVAGGCEIHFSVDYTLKSRSLQFLLSGMFDLLVRKILSAFEERARKLYGAKVA